MSEALTVVVLHHEIGNRVGTCHLLTGSIHRNHLYRIGTRLQAEYIGTETRSILTDELRINLLAIYIYMIRRSSLEWHPLQISRLQPGLRLRNLHNAGRILHTSVLTLLHSLGKVDFSDRSIILIVIASILRSDDSLVALKLHTGQIGSIVIFHISRTGGNKHLVHLAVTSHCMIHLICIYLSQHATGTSQEERQREYHFLHSEFLLHYFMITFLPFTI